MLYLRSYIRCRSQIPPAGPLHWWNPKNRASSLRLFCKSIVDCMYVCFNELNLWFCWGFFLVFIYFSEIFIRFVFTINFIKDILHHPTFLFKRYVFLILLCFFSFQTLMNHFSSQSFTSLLSKVFWDFTELFFFCEGLFLIVIPFLKAKKFSVSSFVFHFFAFKISQFFPLKCLSRDYLLKTIHIHRLKWKVKISPWVDNSQ